VRKRHTVGIAEARLTPNEGTLRADRGTAENPRPSRLAVRYRCLRTAQRAVSDSHEDPAVCYRCLGTAETAVSDSRKQLAGW
jgi:hypothetical protein